MSQSALLSTCLAFALALFLSACKTGSDSAPATPDASGVAYRKDKDLQKVWLADGFDFTGYDSLYIPETLYTAKQRTNEVEMRTWAIGYLQTALADSIRKSGIFTNVVTREADLPAGAKTLKLENTIVEYEKGGGGARYFAGIYGAGQPVLKVHSRLLDGDKPLFQFQAERHGESGVDRVFGGFISDKDVQQRDIDDLAKDLADFISRTAKHAPAK